MGASCEAFGTRKIKQMKKLFLIGPALIGLFLSCNSGVIHNENNPLVVRTIVKDTTGRCVYWCCYEYGTFNSAIQFTDTCGKFNIGDTLIIEKR